MSDSITFGTALRDGRSLIMAKSIKVRGGRIVERYDSPQSGVCRWREVEVSSLHSLMLAVSRAARRGEIAVRGKPLAAVSRRATYIGKNDEAPGLEVVPRRWVAFDWDGLPLTPGLDPLQHGHAAALLALRRLPPCFRRVTVGWQISASAGFKPGFRLRTWHWLDRPVTGSALKAWLKPAIDIGALDPATLVEAQPHFLAVRAFGGPDPCRRRFGILRMCEGETVRLPDIAAIVKAREAQEQAERRAKEGPRPDSIRNPAAASEYAKRRLDECLDRIRGASKGQRHPSYMREAARARAICDRYGVPWAPVANDLMRAYEGTLSVGELRSRRHSSTTGIVRWLDARSTG